MIVGKDTYIRSYTWVFSVSFMVCIILSRHCFANNIYCLTGYIQKNLLFKFLKSKTSTKINYENVMVRTCTDCWQMEEYENEVF